MEIVKIRVKNYSALKDLSMDWQKELSLIIEKIIEEKHHYCLECKLFSEGKERSGNSI